MDERLRNPLLVAHLLVTSERGPIVAPRSSPERAVEPPEWPVEPGRLSRLHGFGEPPDSLLESFRLPLHDLPGGAPRIARDRGNVRVGRVAGAGERSRLATGPRLITGERLATSTRLAAVAPAFPATAGRATA